MVVVLVHESLGGSEVLAGRPAGTAAWARLSPLIQASSSGALVVFDFQGITVLTPSFFVAGIWPAWTTPREPLELFPVIANLPANSIEDIELVLRAKSTAAWQVKIENGEPGEGTLLGDLEEPLRATVAVVVARGEVTPSDLYEHDRQIGLTAWSNRLNALYQHRLVRRRKEGRRMIYAPSWKEQRDG